MAISSPKEQAKSISEGYFSVTVPFLRRLNEAQLRDLLKAIGVIEREVRRDMPKEGDFDAVKKKHFRLGNLRRTRLVIDTFCKQRRIRL